MHKFQKILVVTHVVFKQTNGRMQGLTGPYTAVCQALTKIYNKIETCQIPLNGYEGPLLVGTWQKEYAKKIPEWMGRIVIVKYMYDFVLSAVSTIKFAFKYRTESKLVVAIDPLTCLPLLVLKHIFRFTLVFYCVDFNRTRFSSSLMQKLYELADELSSKKSDQTWVVSESLRQFKRRMYHIESIYIPNATTANPILSSGRGKHKKGNTLVWGGSCITQRQFDLLFAALKSIQTNVRKDLRIIIAPTTDHAKYEKKAKSLKLQAKVLKLSHADWHKQIVAADVGIAVYDNKFGSTEFIEPMKIWEFMMAGLPFIISCEPSLYPKVKNSHVAFPLLPESQVPVDGTLRQFLSPTNLSSLQTKAQLLAEEFEMKKRIMFAIKRLTV